MIRNIKVFVRNEHKKVVVAGCGRSGTLYMSQLLQKLGFKVGHEGFLADGISSWYVVEPTRSLLVKEMMNGLDVTYIHLLRNPTDVISSMWRCELLPNRAALDFFRRVNPEYNYLSGTPAHVAQYWIKWNRLISNLYGGEKNYYRLNIESLQDRIGLTCFCHAIGRKVTGDVVDAVQSLGYRIHELDSTSYALLRQELGTKKIPEIHLDDIYGSDPDVAASLMGEVEHYGYSFYHEGARGQTTHYVTHTGDTC